MKKIFFFIFAFSRLFAQDMTEPPSLKDKILKSDLIVVGHIKKNMNKKGETNSTKNKANIIVEETLKGDYIKQIPIPDKMPLSRERLLHGLIDPPNLTYYVGATEKSFKNNEPIIAFVYKSYEDDYIIIAWNQWDSKNLNPMQIQFYRKKVLEYINIIKLSDKEEKNKKEAEWIISLCENPLTIWDGLSQVSSLSDIFSYAQKIKLRKIIMGLRKIENCKYSVIEFLYSINDNQVLDNMFELLKRQEIRRLYADLVMGFITSFDNSKSVLKLFYKYMDRCEIIEDKNRDICNKLIDEFILAAKKSLTSSSSRPL